MTDILAEWVAVIEPGKVREFARAVHDASAAADPPVPSPTFPIVLSADFVERLVNEVLKLDRRRTLHGEQEYEYRRPLVAGERLRCRARLLDDRMKEGQRGGSMRFVTTEIELADEQGVVVGWERMTSVETAAPGEGAR